MFLVLYQGLLLVQMEMALWCVLGHCPVDVLYWENFGQDWMTDIIEQLRIKDVRIFKAEIWVFTKCA